MAYSRLSDPEYRNWVTVGRAIQITRNGLVNVLQNGVDKYHTRLLSTLAKNVSTWRSHLMTAHRSRDKKKISWRNSDNTQWLTEGASWEIAKIFMAPLGERKHDVVNAQTTDLSGLLNVLEWSPRGSSGIFNTGVDLLKLTDARSSRNTWAHAPQLRICDADKAKAFASFTTLLKDAELHHEKNVQDAINDLNHLLNNGLAVFEEKELELLVELQRQLNLDVVSLKSDMTYWKDQVDANLGQIKNLRRSLDEFIKTNELHNDIETMKKRMDEFEKQISCTNIRLKKLEQNSSLEPEQFVSDGKSSLKFNPVRDRMKEEFVGREWLFSYIDSWLEKDLGLRESRAFSIRGGPGTGKNSIARELVRRQEGKKLAGYHFFQNDNPRTHDLELLVDNLSRMLSKNLPEYAALVGHSYLKDANKFRNHPKKLFDDLITTPLQQLQKGTKSFLLIGALDEGGAKIASYFAKLSAALPPWLRVIFTARNNATTLLSLFPDCTCASLDLKTTNPRSKLLANRFRLRGDMNRFVTMKYEKLKNEHHDYIPPFFLKIDKKTAMNKILNASQNSFLYAKLVMERIFAGHDDIGLPSTLSEIYCLDFMRLFQDKKKNFFKIKIAPILEVVLAVGRVNNKLIEETPAINLEWLKKAVDTSGTFVGKVVEMGLLPCITRSDLNDALKLLSVYLFKNSRGLFTFCHNSVKMWLQENKSDFHCDAINGHHTMVKFHWKILKTPPPHLEDPKTSLMRYLSHASFLPEPRSVDINNVTSEYGIKASDILRVALCNPTLEDLAMKLIGKTDVFDRLSLEEKAQHLQLAIKRNCERVAAKCIVSAYWIFSFEVYNALKDSEMLRESLKCLHFVQKKGSLPQLLFSVLCNWRVSSEMIMFCIKQGATADVCVPKFFKNTEHFDAHICWNEDVQEYFRKLKTGKTNVITLESLKENPSFPKEARIDDYTLEIIQKPISEVERLVKEGECYVCFTYGWHVLALPMPWSLDQSLDMVDLLLKHGADVNHRGYFGKTALMMACKRQEDHLVSFLLDHGAKVNQQDFYGFTALHHALESFRGMPNSSKQVRIIEMLLQHEVDLHLKDWRDISAIDIAEQEGGIVLEKLTGKRRRRDGSEADQDTSQ